jgi:hypothetical protein
MSTTTNLALNEPAYNSTSPTWDQPLNYNSTILDQMFGNTTGVSVSTSGTSTYTNITAPSATAAGSTSQAMRFNLTGALAANQTVLLPQSVAGMWVVSNNTTNAFTVSIGSNNGSNVAAGTTVTVPQGYSTIIFCDATNVKLANDGGITSPLSVSNGGTGSTSLTANNVILGNGTSAVQLVAPSTTGNILVSNGTTWSSAVVSGCLIRAPQILTSGTSYTTPSNCNRIYVECVGGGGGGSGAYTGGSGGGGGGGGGYSSKYFSVSPSNSYSYAIGAAGAGGAVLNSGVNGGSTTFTVGATTIIGGFGYGAVYVSSGDIEGGAGGLGSGGDFNFSGGGGVAGILYNGVSVQAGGAGGSSHFGGGGRGVSGSQGGVTPSGYGGGGSGGSASANGAAGALGVIRIWEYT